MSDPNLVQLYAGISVMTGLRYLMFAGVAWLLAYVWFRRRWFHRKIVQRLPESADVRREMKDSLITVLVFGLVGAITVWAALHGWTRDVLEGQRPRLGLVVDERGPGHRAA